MAGRTAFTDDGQERTLQRLARPPQRQELDPWPLTWHFTGNAKTASPPPAARGTTTTTPSAAVSANSRPPRPAAPQPSSPTPAEGGQIVLGLQSLAHVKYAQPPETKPDTTIHTRAATSPRPARPPSRPSPTTLASPTPSPSATRSAWPAATLSPTWAGRVTFTRDTHGRPCVTNAVITRDMLDEGTDANGNVRPAGFLGGVHDQVRGHLLANRLGGSGDTLDNPLAIIRTPTNSPDTRHGEDQVYRAVAAGRGSSPITSPSTAPTTCPTQCRRASCAKPTTSMAISSSTNHAPTRSRPATTFSRPALPRHQAATPTLRRALPTRVTRGTVAELCRLRG